MSLTINFADQGLGLIIKRTADPVTSKIFSDTFVAFWRNNREALATIRYIYADYTEAGQFEATTDDVVRLAEIAKSVARENTTLIVAVCAPRPEHFGLVRMWENHLLQEISWQTRVFRGQDEAKSWLQQTLHQELTFA